MAKHIRQQLREAFVAALTGTTGAGANVFVDRDWPMDEHAYPALLIWDRGGPSRFGAMAATDAAMPLDRIEDIVVEVAVRRTGGEDAAPKMADALDALAAEVEVIVMASAGIDALVDQRELINTEKDSAIAGDSRRGGCRLTYRCLVTTTAGDPTTRI